jgi:SagB-type dehydrogenase family enzyme
VTAPVIDPVGALEYHRLTIHRPDRSRPPDPRLVDGFQPMRWERKPPQFKTYPGSDGDLLPEDLAPGALDRQGLGRLLFLSAGVMRAMPALGGPLWFRAAGSAGNLSPIEVYLITGEADGLAAGLYHYEPVKHALVALRSVPADTPPALVLTGVPWRTCWKYGERGFRHLWWDAGTMLSQVLACAGEAGWDPRVELGFVDSDVAAFVGARPPHELPLAVVGLDGPPFLPPPEAVAPGHVADEPFEFPLVTAAYRAGELDSAATVDAWREKAPGAGRPAAVGDFSFTEPLDEIVRRRGSARAFDRTGAAPDGLVAAALPWATGAVPAGAVPSGRTLLEHLVLVHAVEGVDPGGYRLDGEGLVELGVGDLRAVGHHLCLDQRLGGDGALTVFHSAALDGVVGALGDRGYRAALLEAGVVEGRLHLAAAALGLGATGLTYYDEEVSRFFVTELAPLLVTAVGVPAYRARPGGTPRRPVRMRGR